MPAPPPLTHHEILEWIAPFTRRGYRVDMGASDRLARRLVLLPPPPTQESPADPSPAQTLRLENPERDRFVLTRELTDASGLTARLEAAGPDPDELLTRIEARPLAEHFRAGPGWLLALSSAVPAAAAGAAGPAAAGPALRRAEARFDGLALQVAMPAVAGYPAEITLTSLRDGQLTLPEDLLAVLGRDWSPLRRAGPVWQGMLEIARREPVRSERAEARIEAAACHLACTLAEPPARFHARFAAARWGVALRIALPLLFLLALFGGVIALPRLGLPQDSVYRMLIMNAPPLLLALGLCLRELPRFVLPRPPRPSTAPGWWQGAGAGADPSPH